MPPFYLCTTELPVELFLDEANRNGELRKVLPVFTENNDPRAGPRKKLRPAHQVLLVHRREQENVTAQPIGIARQLAESGLMTLEGEWASANASLMAQAEKFESDMKTALAELEKKHAFEDGRKKVS